MLAFFMIFSLWVFGICAGCAGFVQSCVHSLKLEKMMENKGLKYFVHSVHGLVNIPCACALARVRARVREKILQLKIRKPCTPCTELNNLLKKRRKVVFKPCTEPCTNPAHYAQSWKGSF